MGRVDTNRRSPLQIPKMRITVLFFGKPFRDEVCRGD